MAAHFNPHLSRPPLRPYQDINPSTKAFEGFLVGAKFSAVYALLWAPFVSKENSLANGTSRALEYLRITGRASVLFCFTLASLYGLKQLIF